MPATVTLLTDFGLQDSYAAEVKAVLLKASSRTTLVDITHLIPPYAIEAGAFQLLRACRTFPKSTWHLAIVDPGVGSERRAVYVRTSRYHFVGPDNGVLLWAVRACEREDGKPARIYEIPRAEGLPPTFHGRDLFAPFITRQLQRPSLRHLVPVMGLQGREFPQAQPHGVGWRGEIIACDHFGNLITSLPYSREELTTQPKVEGVLETLKNRLISAPHYAVIPTGHAALIRGSHGFWEIACRNASASQFLGTGPGAHVTLFPARAKEY